MRGLRASGLKNQASRIRSQESGLKNARAQHGREAGWAAMRRARVRLRLDGRALVCRSACAERGALFPGKLPLPGVEDAAAIGGISGLGLLRTGVVLLWGNGCGLRGGWHGRAPGAGAFGSLGRVAGQPVGRRGNQPCRGAKFIREGGDGAGVSRLYLRETRRLRPGCSRRSLQRGGLGRGAAGRSPGGGNGRLPPGTCSIAVNACGTRWSERGVEVGKISGGRRRYGRSPGSGTGSGTG